MDDKKGYDKEKVIKRKLLFPAEKFSFFIFFPGISGGDAFWWKRVRPTVVSLSLQFQRLSFLKKVQKCAFSVSPCQVNIRLLVVFNQGNPICM